MMGNYFQRLKCFETVGTQSPQATIAAKAVTARSRGREPTGCDCSAPVAAGALSVIFPPADAGGYVLARLRRLNEGLLTFFLAFTILSVSTSAQETAPLEDWEEFADSRPFPTSRITIPKWRLSNGPHVRSAFRELIAEARQATVRVRTDGRDTALGGIVGAEGWILTKASRLPGEVTCLLADQRELNARIVGVNRDYDLALLKIDAQQLPTLRLKNSPAPDVGAWLATVGMKRGPQAVGVMSVGPREISHRAGTLGVRLDEHTDRPLITQIFPHTGAEAAGLQADDLVLSVNGQPTRTRRDFIRRIREHSPGDPLNLQVRRGEETLEITALLQGRRPWRLPTREEFQNQLGSQLSQRRFGFPSAFQHDTVIKPSDCGGPVVNLNGEVVGFNLARAGRTETYAIPTDVVVELIEEMKTH